MTNAKAGVMDDYLTVKIRRMGVSLGTVNASGAITLIATGVVHTGPQITGVVIISVAALARDAVMGHREQRRDNGEPPTAPHIASV
ncbi:hypothetical protein OG864_29750 [Streptomyces sp. NBC_00124]|uniref:hypothetical protein n=1 Tax=Streptomyces sp. NBC_00124 TaxID=2975662 RepID=UPI00224D3439|nr:hypothetical protein [Streptomyces sp. NBC_00124]MCX5362886.1 hypothetical protein [Streptomyces sp. NBC_00124]